MTCGYLCDLCRTHARQKPDSPPDPVFCLLEHRNIATLLWFRAGGLTFTERFQTASEDYVFLSGEDACSEILRELEISCFGPEKAIELTLLEIDYIPPRIVFVKEITPEEGDLSTKVWVDDEGQEKSVVLAPYAIANVAQHLTRFSAYLAQNYNMWAKGADAPFPAIVGLVEIEVRPSLYRHFYRRLLMFILAALHKTSTDYISGGDTLDTPVIQQKGHRLDGKRIAPRMITAQQDPLFTLKYLIPAQHHLMASFDAWLECDGADHWGVLFMSIAALCRMGTIMIKDRKRHGDENSSKGPYTLPRFVTDLTSALMILLAKFHKWEGKVGRFEGLELSDADVQEYYSSLRGVKEAGAALRDDEIDNVDWWLAQLMTEPEDWVPRPTPLLAEED